MNIESPEQKPSKSIGFAIPLILIVLLIAGVGYFVSTQSGLDEAAFKQALDDWSAQLEEYSANEDTYMRFEYDSLKMEGGITDRHAIVKNPRFETELDDEEGKIAVAVETPTALIYPTSIKFNKARIVLPEPLTIESDGKETAQVTTAGGMEVDASQTQEDDIPFTTIQAALPTDTTIQFLQEDKTAIIKLDEGGTLLTKFTASDRNLGIFNVSANNVAMQEDEEQFLTIDMLDIQSTATSTGDNTYDVSIDASAEQLFSTKEDMPYGAIDTAITMNYTGPLQEGDESIDWVSNAVTLSIPSLFIKAGDIDISANVDAKTLGQGDPFPIGKASINVENLPFVVAELEKNEMLDASDKKIANALLKQAVGHTLEDSESLKLNIAREDGGSMTIGNISFEQALGIILTGGGAGAPAASDPHAHHNHNHAMPEDDGVTIEDAAADSFKKALEKEAISNE